MPSSRRRYLAALDLGGTYIKAILATDDFTPRVVLQAESNVSAGAESVVIRLGDTVERLLREAGAHDAELLGIGVSSFGMIDWERGVGIGSRRMDHSGVPIAALLQRRFGAPVKIDNDAHAAILGEKHFGAAAGFHDIVQFNLGTGLATGIISNDQVVRGIANVAGEVAHFVIETTGGDLCRCGKTGCAGAYVSGEAIVRHARQLLRDDRTSTLWNACAGDLDALRVDMFHDALDRGDRVAQRVIDRTVFYLASLVSSMITTFNPGVVVIGGGVSQLGDKLLEPLRTETGGRLLHESYRCPIVAARLGSHSGAFGALVLIAQRLGLPLDEGAMATAAASWETLWQEAPTARAPLVELN